MNSRFIQIDADGYLTSSGIRLNDNVFGRETLKNLIIQNRIYQSQVNGNHFTVLPNDEPLVVRQFSVLPEGKCELLMPYDYKIVLPVARLSADEWDRFHALTDNGIGIVFSRSAQAEMFRLASKFDDDSITISGEKVIVRPWLPNITSASTKGFWDERYIQWSTTGEKPGWDQMGHHPALPEILQQIKIPKARIAVLGAGVSHDAHYLAEQSHLVTAFDISPNAIERAKNLYPESKNLKYIQADLLNLPKEYHGQFDLVFEHTFFCAINPPDRSKVIQLYKKLLVDGGHLLGIFFAMTNGEAPPFGATEWELRERLQRSFQFLYWSRPLKNPPGREYWELVIYAKKDKV